MVFYLFKWYPICSHFVHQQSDTWCRRHSHWHTACDHRGWWSQYHGVTTPSTAHRWNRTPHTQTATSKSVYFSYTQTAAHSSTQKHTHTHHTKTCRHRHRHTHITSKLQKANQCIPVTHGHWHTYTDTHACTHTHMHAHTHTHQQACRQVQVAECTLDRDLVSHGLDTGGVALQLALLLLRLRVPHLQVEVIGSRHLNHKWVYVLNIMHLYLQQTYFNFSQFLKF